MLAKRGAERTSRRAYLEREILLQLAELLDLGFDLGLAPVLDQFLRSKRSLRALALAFALSLDSVSEGSGSGGSVPASPAFSSTRRASMLSRARCAWWMASASRPAVRSSAMLSL
jgi:hypothetical protein